MLEASISVKIHESVMLFFFKIEAEKVPFAT